MYVELPHPSLGVLKTTGVPVKLSATPAASRVAPPAAGRRHRRGAGRQRLLRRRDRGAARRGSDLTSWRDAARPARRHGVGAASGMGARVRRRDRGRPHRRGRPRGLTAPARRGDRCARSTASCRASSTCTSTARGGGMFEEGRAEVAEHISALLPHFGTTGIAATVAALPPDRLRAAVTAIAPRRAALRRRAPPRHPSRRSVPQPAARRRATGGVDAGAVARRARCAAGRSGGMIRLVTAGPGAAGRARVHRRRAAARHRGRARPQRGDARTRCWPPIAAGATHVTHLFNAAAPLHHRAPGLIGTALTDDRLSVELIADGVHVHRRAIDVALRCKPAGQGRAGERRGGGGRHAGRRRSSSSACRASPATRCASGHGQLAGSRLTLDAALRNLHAWFPAAPLERLLACGDGGAGRAARLAASALGSDRAGLRRRSRRAHAGARRRRDHRRRARSCTVRDRSHSTCAGARQRGKSRLTASAATLACAPRRFGGDDATSRGSDSWQREVWRWRADAGGRAPPGGRPSRDPRGR